MSCVLDHTIYIQQPKIFHHLIESLSSNIIMLSQCHGRRSCVKCNYSRKEKKYTVYFFFLAWNLVLLQSIYLNAFCEFTVISLFSLKKMLLYWAFYRDKKKIYKKNWKDLPIYQTLYKFKYML